MFFCKTISLTMTWHIFGSQYNVARLQVWILIWNSAVTSSRKCRVFDVMPIVAIQPAAAIQPVVVVRWLDGRGPRYLAGTGCQRLLLVDCTCLSIRCKWVLRKNGMLLTWFGRVFYKFLLMPFIIIKSLIWTPAQPTLIASPSLHGWQG